MGRDDDGLPRKESQLSKFIGPGTLLEESKSTHGLLRFLLPRLSPVLPQAAQGFRGAMEFLHLNAAKRPVENGDLVHPPDVAQPQGQGAPGLIPLEDQRPIAKRALLLAVEVELAKAILLAGVDVAETKGHV